MSIIVDGYTMLFFDKFAGLHNYDNPATIKMTLTDLFASDFKQLTNIIAINEFNKFGGIYQIPTNLDQELFQVIVFMTTYGPTKALAMYTVIGINNNILKKHVIEKIQIPNHQLLLCLCRYHNMYSKTMKYGFVLSNTPNINELSTDIITHIKNHTGDIIDKMENNPEFLTCDLFPYQKRSVYWMLQKEREEKTIIIDINDKVIIGDVYYDTIKQSLTTGGDRKKITFNGGALTDEVGLGKTVQMTSLSLLNPAKDLSYIRQDQPKLFSKATLVLCPNQLCGQWKREIEKMVNITEDYDVKIILLLTKINYDKVSYQDLLDADFVIVSYNFLDNQCYLGGWMKNLSTSKSYHKSALFNLSDVKDVFTKLGKELVKNPAFLSNKNPIINLINWHRIVVDEFHEIYTVTKYEHMKNLLVTFDAKYKWAVTGTPFDKGNVCLLKMLDFVTNYENPYVDKILTIPAIAEHMKYDFFRRNTKASVKEEYQLPPLKETVMKLKFTQTERMIYNAYLANPNNDKFSIFLRKLCCHPTLADETKDMLSNCKTLSDIEKTMVLHYEKSKQTSYNVVLYLKKRIIISENKIKIIEKKRQRKFLRKIGYTVSIKKEEINIDINNDQCEIKGINLEEFGINIENQEGIPEENDDDGDDEPIEGKTHIIVSDENQDKINNLIGNLLKANNSITIQHIREYISTINTKLTEAQKRYEGAKTTSDFYKNVFDRIKKTAKKSDIIDDIKDNENIKNNDNTDDSDDDEICGICLNEIPENDIGVTKCGHVYCYQCIKTIIIQRHQCPVCRKNINQNELFMISYEKKQKKSDYSIDLKNKLELIDKVGTKIANIIYYIKSVPDHIIIFSQWDDMLRKIGNILDDYGIQNVLCRGNVFQRDKAIRLFSSDPKMRVIMLSSESAASGTNLTKASKVILTDPVCGTYEYRKNTEGQAVGRAHRTGQLNEVEVLRFIICDTIEEEIFKANIVDDIKHIPKFQIFESTDDLIILTDDKLNELSSSIKASTEKKAIKKITVKGIHNKVEMKMKEKEKEEVEDEN